MFCSLDRSCSRPPPAPKPGGFFTVSLPPRRLHYRVLTVVTYACRTKYVLRGVRQRMCGKNGHWNPQGKKSKCVPIGCGGLNNVQAKGVLTQSFLSGPPYPLGSVVSFSCPAPFELSGPKQIVCSETGNWHPNEDKPQCILASGCASPPPPPWNGLSTAANITGIPYPVGFWVNYTCTNGYGLDGIPYRICGHDGTWWPSSRRHQCVCK